MRYTLNIAKRFLRGIDGEARYEHLAKVQLPGDTEEEAVRLAKDFAERFPVPDFKVDLTDWGRVTGRDVKF